MNESLAPSYKKRGAPAPVLLGVNVDHVATVRQARRERFPDPVEIALAAEAAGADGVTAHLREDRRHIQDDDIARLKSALRVPLNMEMAAVPSIIDIAEGVRPAWVCLVPERREELTTEGGLDLGAAKGRLREAVARMRRVGVRVSLFIEPAPEAAAAASDLGADAVEFHTGAYAHASEAGGAPRAQAELERLRVAADEAARRGLIVNAGHGLTYENVGALASLFPFHEFNIGFSIIARSFRVGIGAAVKEMKERMTSVCAAS